MRPTFRYGMSTRTPDPSFRPAGADVSEPDTSQGVATVAVFVDTERHPLYGDRVEHATNLRNEGLGDQLSCVIGAPQRHITRSVRNVPGASSAAFDAGSEAAEALRQSRLSRWQQQR